jgi:hypothetical protein
MMDSRAMGNLSGGKSQDLLITIGVLRFVAFQDHFAELRAHARLLRVCLEI